MVEPRDGIRYLDSLALWTGRGRFSLENISAVLSALGDPQEHFRAIIVGGTNGKGSVSSAIASILGQFGYRVGLNISPHLVTINERIIVDGLPVSEEQLEEIADRIKHISERTRTVLSYHEALTVAAFMAFHDSELDWGVLEVGVGGRLDAANVIRAPHLSCVVSVDFDHVHLLGDTLSKITTEKCGIMRAGGLFVTGSLQPESEKVVARLGDELSIKRAVFDRDYSFIPLSAESGESRARFISKELGSFDFAPALQGYHQVHNMAVAICCARLLGASEDACKRGVSMLNWPGRLEIVSCGEGRLLLDCAHNPAGMRALVSYLRSRGWESVSMVFGALETKEWREMIDIVAPLASSWLISEPEGDGAVSAQEIAAYVSSLGVSSSQQIEQFGGEYGRLLEVLKKREGSTPTVVCGSIYMVGAIRRLAVGANSRFWRHNSTCGNQNGCHN